MIKIKKYSAKAEKKEVSLLNLCLILVIGFLLIVLISGTIVGLKNKKLDKEVSENELNANAKNANKQVESFNKIDSEQIAAYKGVGRLRILTAPDEKKENDFGCAMVVSPWFTYPKDDKTFFEELSKKRLLITEIITDYFSGKTRDELSKTSEEKIKADLLKEINKQLSLGKIDAVYFSDYLFLE